MRHYPPAHVIHEATCPDNPGSLIEFKASALVVAYPTSRPHTCFSRDTVTHNRDVVAEPDSFELHRYEPSTLHPADAVRPLCKVCRGTHPDDADAPVGDLATPSGHWR